MFAGIEKEIEGSVMVICFNVPKKKNAISPVMYEGFIEYLNEAARNSDIKIVCVTGKGEFYSSGNDFSIITGKESDEERQEFLDTQNKHPLFK